jgi:ketosteroid isomerase-like protein
MSEESRSPDLVELTRRGSEAASRGELGVAMNLFTSDAVVVTERFGRFEGRDAIRGYFEDWFGSFEDLTVELRDPLDLGNGVVFAPQIVTGRYAGSAAAIQLRNAVVYEFQNGLIVRSTTYVDIDDARSAAERLAEGRAMSKNLDFVRSIHRRFERGEFTNAEWWAHPEIECVAVDGPAPDSGTGLTGMARVWRDFLQAYDGFSLTVEEYCEIDARRVLVLIRCRGRAKASGVEIESMPTRNASVYDIEDGSVRRLALYWDRERAFADLGLAD